MKLICTICARGGSKGTPGKNIRPFAGKPLIVHTIECAQAYGRFDTIVVSTDDEQIAQVAREAGAAVPFMRPAHLATDAAPKLPAICHAVETAERLEALRFDLVVDLQPTSPLTEPDDIAGALTTLLDSGAGNVVTVCRARKNPYYDMVAVEGGRVRFAAQPPGPIVRRQDAPAVYELNGAVYVWRRDVLESAAGVISDSTAIYEMPVERSLDIDSPLDFAIAEFIKTEMSDSPMAS